ncbi:hypothetical protein A3J90_07945 [candidate division WOR-1 bacterium RIFOXYC2_FULL_37_10]|uniref:Uncharacterized protein n=1 Tax=candidate division WOR-1 bacterium RIFOXYB2_FULL_37_13 TaxID=1802579 RepID=A0A1F4SPL4_UNCSA|nr:MAG: hypothetical protein A2310_01820 [candidate division WOR-1 bacterium RIFOXYB2_FULL_37_13]OGC35215.1 MAG: hypothetical protein A3J90_07945 [candidate division WOR-1 bacterium RIFOXYC2_FULL_37_10]
MNRYEVFHKLILAYHMEKNMTIRISSYISTASRAAFSSAIASRSKKDNIGEERASTLIIR